MTVASQIIVLGAEGQLGSELCRQLGPRTIPIARSDCDLLDSEVLADTVRKLRPRALINSAAYTAVDRAEQEPELCHAINARAVGVLAEVCRELDCLLVQISTDYVFGADASRSTPYRETDLPAPVNIYGHSKLAGERHAATCPRHLIVRTCGLYGHRCKPKQSNFVDTMLRLARERDHLRIVDDQHCTPSYVVHVARAIIHLVAADAAGRVHVVNGGETTWHDFAAEIFRLTKLSPKVDRISTAEFASPAKRPLYSVLDSTKCQVLGLNLPTWQAAIAEYLT